MTTYKVSCPTCDGVRDSRAKQCKPCFHKFNPPWLGKGPGRRVGKNGYVTVRRGREWIYEHRLVMETALGRKLERTEHVHHKNGISTDNRAENLEVLQASDHAREHLTPRAKAMSLKGHAARWGKR